VISSSQARGNTDPVRLRLRVVTDSLHSSPLRISGPVIMWLHYDVKFIAKFMYDLRLT
jgi:hypothetical protein